MKMKSNNEKHLSNEQLLKLYKRIIAQILEIG